jgi:serine/threonine-protein kinase
MLHEELAALQARCEAEAPQLVDAVRALRQRVRQQAAQAPTVLREPSQPAVPAAATAPAASERYSRPTLLAVGGMGEVYRVHDRALRRDVVLKRMRPELADRAASRARFVEEAQATAQLEHPSIVPVHDLGTDDRGQPWFVMQEVRGSTLSDAIAEAHAQPGAQRRAALHRLVSVLHQASQAVAFAHARGVVHRDLKPDNVLLGAFGEVFVMDWGLAKLVGAEPDLDEAEPTDSVVTDRLLSGAQTRVGTVAGTPAYMAPEQAAGQLHRIGPHTDVYALGAILYEVLSGRRPFDGPHGDLVVQQVLAGPPPSLSDMGDSTLEATFTFDHSTQATLSGVEGELPAELVEACERAMAREPAERFATAEAFAAELEGWLDGSARRDRALELVRRARANRPEALRLEGDAAALEAEAEALLRDVPGWAPESDKQTAWALQERAEVLRRQATLRHLEREQLLVAALTHVPDLVEAHEALVDEYQARHAAAEAAGRTDEVLQAGAMLRRHVLALPDDLARRQQVVRYLNGDGTLTLLSDPPGAEVTLYRLRTQGRRLREELVGSLGTTPLRRQALPRGSYVVVLTAPDRAEVRVPVHVPRNGHASALPPGADAPVAVPLPRVDELGADEVLVPGGWFVAGDDDDPSAPPRRRRWCDAFVMERHPVTNADWLGFLDALDRSDRHDEALRWVPREMASRPGELGAMIYGHEPDRGFFLTADADGDVWHADAPVLMVSHAAARAYAAYRADRDGLPWRLPSEWEWEKAARGVDGRRYPWGERSDPSFACHFPSHAGPPQPAPIARFPTDCSVYGIRGLAGNTRCFCLEPWVAPDELPDTERVVIDDRPLPEGAHAVTRGNAWSDGRLEGLAHRHVAKGGLGYFSRGVRLVRSYR